MEKKESKFYYIYNMKQADFLFKNNVIGIGAGTGRQGDAYVLFPKTKKSIEVMDRWNKICREINEVI